MQDFDSLGVELSDEADYEIERLSDDEYGSQTHEIFFYGQLIDDDLYRDVSPEEEGAFYTKCPECGRVHMIDIDMCYPGNDFACPDCSHSGTLHPFNDMNDALDRVNASYYAWWDSCEGGYVLRLFESYYDFSDRDYSDHNSLEFYPNMYVDEVYREAWIDGKISYWKRNGVHYEPLDYKPYDGCYWLVNLESSCDDLGTGYCMDILYTKANDEEEDSTLIERVANSVSMRTLATLKRYGFEDLVFVYPFMATSFPDSAKISEVLGVDYNQVVAKLGREEVKVRDILSARRLQEYGVELSRDNVYIMKILSEIKNFDMTPQNASKTFKYLRNQIRKHKKVSSSYLIRDYVDYLEDCKKLGYDTESSIVRYPTDLVEAHDTNMKLVQIANAAATDNALREIYERYHHLLEWSDGDYCLVMPQTSEEIVEEGAAQNHCVAKYAERMANGEDFILFLRKKDAPQKSFYTIEIKPDLRKYELVQCRGYHNEDESAAIRAAVDMFMAKYEAWFKRREVTDAPESTIRTYYKAVKKMADGKYISAWDNLTEYVVGKEIMATMCEDPDKTAVPGIHVASLGFAMSYGDYWKDVAILEIEVDIHDVVIPDAKDQIRTKRGFVKREVPFSELGEWGERHQKMREAA